MKSALPTDVSAARRGGLPWLVGLALLTAAGAAAWAATSGEDLAERRRQLAALTPEAKDELQRRQQRFMALDPAERTRLRRLHEEIEADPDAAKLKRVLRHYYDWMTSLPSMRRAELAGMPADQRIGQIRTMLDEQNRRQEQRLGRQDAAVVLKAMEQYLSRLRPQLVRALPDFQQRELEERVDRVNPAQRDRALLALFLFRWHWGAPLELPAPGADELSQLCQQLTPEWRQRLESKPPAEQWALLTEGLKQWAREGEGRELLFAVSENELSRFFEQDLTDEQRDSLLSLSADEAQRELRRMYWMPHSESYFRKPDHLMKHGGPPEPGKMWPKRGPGAPGGPSERGPGAPGGPNDFSPRPPNSSGAEDDKGPHAWNNAGPPPRRPDEAHP